MKGDGWLISHNTGVNALLDGFQTHVPLCGWGQDNVFASNVATVNASGFGFRLQTPASSPNVIRCDNVATAAGAGFANAACSN